MEPNETTPDEMPWKDAIIKVLQDDDRPLHYREIAQFIGDRELRSRIGATPWNTVSRDLSSMVNQDDKDYDSRIRKADKVGRGYYEYVTSDSASDDNASFVEDPIPDDEEQDHDPNHIVRVPAFGLYWEKDKVRWNSGEILGCLAMGSRKVNFAGQKGVYLLHNGRSVVYVGCTTNSLHARLRAHNRDHKSMHWDHFSWFGFCGVDEESGELRSMPGKVDSAHLTGILEAVLIEALEPPANGRRGDFLGIPYKQVPDPEIAREQSHSFLQNLTG